MDEFTDQRLERVVERLEEATRMLSTSVGLLAESVQLERPHLCLVSRPEGECDDG